MINIKNLFSSLSSLLTSRITDKDISNLKGSVNALNYELSLLRYKDSDDEDIRLAYEYLKKRPFCAALFPYEKMRDMPPIEVLTDKALKMCYVVHNGHPLYFPKGEKEKLIRRLFRYAIEDNDIEGNGYRQRNPHAYQSERYHIEEGDILIDAEDGRGVVSLDGMGDAFDEILDMLYERLKKSPDEKEMNVEIDAGSPRGLLALDVIDKVSKVYMVEHSKRWWEPIEATFAPYKDKFELVKGSLSSKKKKISGENKDENKEKKKKKEERKIGLVNLLEKCGQQSVFVTMDREGEELEVLRDAKEYLQAAKSPITLAVCAYHRTTDYDDLMRFFEEIGYHTEAQPGYIYTDMNDGRGICSLRKGIIRASNR